jgi:hypothetical protein
MNIAECFSQKLKRQINRLASEIQERESMYNS